MRAYIENSGAPEYIGWMVAVKDRLNAMKNPIGASGMLRFIEAADQVRGEAGEHQIDDARTALAQAYGGGAQYFAMGVLRSTKD